MKAVHTIAFILVIVGGLNWLAIGLFNWGIVDLIGMTIGRVVYILVGLSAVYLIFTHKSSCRHCESGGAKTSSAPQM